MGRENEKKKGMAKKEEIKAVKLKTKKVSSGGKTSSILYM